MHAGVIRDMEQQRLRKERALEFQTQRALEEEYRKLQTVDDGRNNVAAGEGVRGSADDKGMSPPR